MGSIESRIIKSGSKESLFVEPCCLLACVFLIVGYVYLMKSGVHKSETQNPRGAEQTNSHFKCNEHIQWSPFLLLPDEGKGGVEMFSLQNYSWKHSEVGHCQLLFCTLRFGQRGTGYLAQAHPRHLKLDPRLEFLPFYHTWSFIDILRTILACKLRKLGAFAQTSTGCQ